MSKRRLVICDGALPQSIQAGEDLDVCSYAEFVARARSGAWARQILRYRDVGMIVARAWLRPKPLLGTIVLRLLSRGACWLLDDSGCVTKVGLGFVLRALAAFLADALRLPWLYRDTTTELASLEAWAATRNPRRPGPGLPLYLRTDLWFAPQVGGSVAHMAGVANRLDRHHGSPMVFSPMSNPLLRQDISWTRILPAPGYWDFREIPALAFSGSASRDIKAALCGMRPSFIYQRYSLNSYAAAMLARDLDVPLVTEYNGSEVWIGRHWGRAPAYSRLSAQIELLNVQAAELVVVVSAPLRDELVERGVIREKILVNPNGVDTDLFHPAIDAAELRQSLGIAGKSVVGFLGTFGPWHGVETLIKAMAELLRRDRDLAGRVHLLLIGDGERRAAAAALARQLDIAEHCSFIGLVSQRDAPRYLACCDMLVAPHVPNTDGSQFFGSPTKLFEYMSMGRPIVASRLGQIGEVIEHGKTGWLVSPGSPQALAEGLSLLLDNAQLAAALGMAAREHVVREYSWDRHVEKIATALADIRT